MQVSTHRPQYSHACDVDRTPLTEWMAWWGHTSTQSRQWRQRSSKYKRSGRKFWLSGLWHHQQESGHPFRKTVVRMPGPSCVAKRIMLRINAETSPSTVAIVYNLTRLTF